MPIQKPKKRRRWALIAVGGIGLVILAAFPAAAEEQPVYTSLFSDLAVKGYDPVAFFEQDMPVEGSEQFELEHRGATWRFASQEHLDMFRADPEQYSPQYGGFCAWAVANGDKAAGKPEFWRIVDGKLYLNYSEKVQEKWEKDIPGFIKKANGNWPAAVQ